MFWNKSPIVYLLLASFSLLVVLMAACSAIQPIATTPQAEPIILPTATPATLTQELSTNNTLQITSETGIDLEGILADPDNLDTDGDQIPDLQEILLTATDPLVADTDGDGIDDSLEDDDEDLVTNLEELVIGTDPLLADTDGDHLDDHAEVINGTDPIKADTDDDGLTDDSEVALGTDPTAADSDGNGVLDGHETYTTVALAADGTVVVELTGQGDVAKQTEVRMMTGDVRLQQLAGQVGPAVRVLTDQPLTNLRIKLPFTIAQLPDGDREGIGILRYDTEVIHYELLGRTGKDESHVWVDYPGTGIFVPIHRPTWEAHLQKVRETSQN